MKSIIIVLTILLVNSFCNGVDVRTSSGLVRGQTIEAFNQTIDEFLGIPFAEPPIGDLRFAKPKPIDKPLTGVIDATKAKNSCLQNINPLFNAYMGGNINVSEDCLFVNIWSQSSNRNTSELKPVMFWIYGGALSIGSIFEDQYNGSVLASNDVLFVSTNYRLGNFGFLYGNDSTAPGNVGYYDQNLALKWVRDNIHLFGGDKNQITIFGESAGSSSVSAHIISQESRGLFRRAIMESATIMLNKDRPIVSAEEGLINAKSLANRLNCSDDKTWLSCLRNVSSGQILGGGLLPGQLAPTRPVFGTNFLPILPQKAFNDKKFNKGLDIMAGVNTDEGSLAPNIFPNLFANRSLSRDTFRQFVTQMNDIYHNIDIEAVTDFYLRNVSPNDSEEINSRIIDFFGDIVTKCSTYRFAKRYAEQTEPSLLGSLFRQNKNNVFFYHLTHARNGTAGGIVPHTADLPFVFRYQLSTEEDIAFSNTIIQYWTHFAKYGTPDDGSTWRPMNRQFDGPIKDLTPEASNRYFFGLFDSTCNGIWSNYY